MLEPQRTGGGHRLFNDADTDRVCEIKRWIDNGVQVSKVKMLSSNENIDAQSGWRDQQEALLTHLQNGNLHSLRTWIKECGQDYPTQILTTHLFTPLRRRLQCRQPTLQALLVILDGVLIDYVSTRPASACKKQGKDALVVGRSIQDTTRLWLEDWAANQQGWYIDVFAHSLNQLRLELFEGRILLV